MRFQESGWSFAVNEPQLLHIALFIRDSEGLSVPADAAIPPPLRVSEFGGSADEQAVDGDLGLEWATWWRRLVAFEARSASAASESQPGHTRRTLRVLADAHAAIFDAPAFDTLSSSPALRELVTRRHQDAITWSNPGRAHESSQDSEFGGPFSTEAMRRAAESVASERSAHGVELSASLSVLPVRGVWWSIAAPGYALCSAETLSDSNSAEVVTREAFLSGLGGPSS